jgi:hypothetical protein
LSAPVPLALGLALGALEKFVSVRLGALACDDGPLVLEGGAFESPAAPLTGGRVSIKDAPKEDVGLKALKPAKPVAWGCNGVDSMEEVFVFVVVAFENAPNDSDDKASDKPEVDVV